MTVLSHESAVNVHTGLKAIKTLRQVFQDFQDDQDF